MDSIRHDHDLRAALHSIYAAQFAAVHACRPGIFLRQDATRMLTGLMGARRWSWRVVGITREALAVFEEHGFQRAAGRVQRGHLVSRYSTAESLYFNRPAPAPLAEFFDFFLERDKTVLMTKAQHGRHDERARLEYIRFDPAHELFACHAQIGWIHGEAEVEYLRRLRAENPVTA